MQLTVLVGDDDLAIRQRRAALLEAAAIGPFGIETLEVPLDGGEALVVAATAPSMFGGVRVVSAEGIDALSEGNAAALAEAGPASDAVIVARAQGLIPTRVRKLLAGAGEVVSLSLPRGKAVTGRITEMARAAGVVLGPPERALLAARGGDDLSRVATVLSQLAASGRTRPSTSQLEMLLGSTAAAGAPWEVSDALEQDDLAKALEAAHRLEPVAVVAYLCNRATQLTRIIDAGLSDGAAVMAELGLAHRFMADKLLRVATGLGEAGVRSMWEVLGGADRTVKWSRHPEAALDLVLAQLSSLYRR